MLKPDPSRLSLAAWGLICLLVVSLILAGCGGAAGPTVEEVLPEASNPEAQVETEPTEEVAVVAQNTTAAEEATATVAPTPEEEVAAEPEEEEAVAEQQDPQAVSPGASTCEPLEIPINDRISPVSEADWAKGPATAPVTVVELGDFQ